MLAVPGVTVDEARLAAVCARYGIARLHVFGSVARGTAIPDSDIDVLFELKPGRRLGWEIEQLADELAAVLGAAASARSLLTRSTTVTPGGSS
jgi:predicted nucleotidyltransferase